MTVEVDTESTDRLGRARAGLPDDWDALALPTQRLGGSI